MHNYTRSGIIGIAMRNPIVHNALQQWRAGECTFEEAMIFAVVHFDIEYTRVQQKELKEIMDMSPRVNILTYKFSSGTEVCLPIDITDVTGVKRRFTITLNDEKGVTDCVLGE